MPEQNAATVVCDYLSSDDDDPPDEEGQLLSKDIEIGIGKKQVSIMSKLRSRDY